MEEHPCRHPGRYYVDEDGHYRCSLCDEMVAVAHPEIEEGESEMKKHQIVRVSPNHPTAHAASEAITEATKAESQTLCGAGLGPDSLLGRKRDLVTCSKCKGILKPKPKAKKVKRQAAKPKGK